MTTHFRTAVAEQWSFRFYAVALDRDSHALDTERHCIKIDCRVLADPLDDPELCELPLDDPKIVAFIKRSPDFELLWSKVIALINRRKRAGGKMQVNFVCNDGKYRSVALVELANEYALAEFKP